MFIWKPSEGDGNMEDVIEVKNLYKSYGLGDGQVDILKDINVTIKQGEFVSIMGPSGSGKSTLLYLMGGLDKPSKGSVEIKGRNIAEMKDEEESKVRCREIGFVFQFYNLLPNLTVEENIMLPILLDNKKEKDYKDSLNRIVEIVGLNDRRKHTPRELSGGQQQRVAIARALINEPDIILADEPIGNLDSKTGIEIMELMQRINKESHKTIVQVTHSAEASTYGNRTIFLRDGEICSKLYKD